MSLKRMSCLNPRPCPSDRKVWRSLSGPGKSLNEGVRVEHKKLLIYRFIHVLALSDHYDCR